MYGTLLHPLGPALAIAALLRPEILMTLLILGVAIVLDRRFPLRAAPPRHRPMPRPKPPVDEATEAQACEWIRSS